MTVIQTTNATVAQIEDALKAGRKIDDIVREFMEPRNNVVAIWQDLRHRGEIGSNSTPEKTPGSPVSGRSLASVPASPQAASAPSVEALANAAARSSSKRTQALGTKFADLASVLRTRLAEEREAAEREAKEAAERAEARREVEELERRLAEARAKAGIRRPARQGGVSSVPREKKPLSEAQQQQLAKMREAGRNTEPCAKGCGYVAKTKAGKTAHESGSKCPGRAS